MVLGDGALAAGADCPRIRRSTPGIGYALDEMGRLTHVRAGWVTDEAIRARTCCCRGPSRLPAVQDQRELPGPLRYHSS